MLFFNCIFRKRSINNKYFLFHTNMLRSMVYDQENWFYVSFDCTSFGTYQVTASRHENSLTQKRLPYQRCNLYGILFSQKNKRKLLQLNWNKLPKKSNLIDRSQIRCCIKECLFMSRRMYTFYFPRRNRVKTQARLILKETVWNNVI